MLSFLERYTILLESQPAYFPNLNLIEHAWTLLKRQFTADFPDISTQ